MTNEDSDRTPYRGRLSPPGRTMYDDSIEASSDDVGGSDDGYTFSAGYDSQMATRIGDEENSDRYTRRLRELHEGRHQSDGQHSVRESQRDKKRISQAICSALPLASHERESVVTVVENLNLDRFGNQKGIPRVTLGVVAVVVDEQHRAEAEDSNEIVMWTDEFRTLCEKHEVSMSDHSTIKAKIREILETESVPMTSAPGKRDPALPGPTPLDERPDEFWEELSAEAWVSVARRWEKHPQEFQDAIPDEYREVVENLRKHEPWQDGEDTDTIDAEGESTVQAPADDERELTDFEVYNKEADFSNWIFNKKLTFENTVFKKGAKFENTIFKYNADFKETDFEGEVDFTNANFEVANFNNATFEEVANFDQAIFKADADFTNVTFEEKANFNNTTFERRANFNGAMFERGWDLNGQPSKE